MASVNAAKTNRVGESKAGKRQGWGIAALLAIVTCGGTVLSGCAGLANTSTTKPTPQEAVQISPSDITFASVPVGQKATQIATLTNTGNEAVTITQLASSAIEFATSGLAMPMLIRPGQSTRFTVAYSGSTSGSASGTLMAMTSHGSSTHVKLKGNNAAGTSQLSLSATTLNFGNVLVNGTVTQAVTLKNSGQSDVQVSQIAVTGGAFSASGMAAPVTISAGQSMALQTTFAPKAAGAATGAITVTSNATNPTATVALTGSAVAASYTMSLLPSSLNFGNVSAGSSTTQNVQVSNTGNSSVTVTQVAASGAGISVGALGAPVTIAPSQSLTLHVTFAPTTAGATAGSVTVTNNDGVNAVAAVTGTQVQPGLSLTPTSVSFGSVVTGNKSSQTVQIKNSGTANLTVSQATVTGAGFSANGMTLPLTLTPGQSASLNVQYAPQAAGTASGLLSIVSNAPNSPATVALSGTGTAAASTMSLSPASLNFGNVNAGSSSTQSLQLANTGNSSVTVTQVAASGAGISVGGLAVPVTLAPAQSVALNVTFAPTTSGATSGSVTVTNSGGTNAVAAVTGTQVQPGLSLTPTSASFGSVVIGSTNSQTVQIKNSGTASLTVSQATVTGAGFTLSGLAVPLTLTPGQSGNFNVQYAPQSAGSVSGGVSIVSNAPNSPATVALSATGVVASHTISVNPGSLSFGSVTDGSSASQGFTVTNTGNSSVSISGITATGTGYSLLSGAGALTLSPNQSTSVSVQFAPSAAGSASGSVNILSNATGSASSVALSGSGVAATVAHSVALNWGASSSSVSGYNVYRSTVSGSAYAKMNGSMLGGVNYADSSVQSGHTYYYVATAVDGSGNESVYSNEVAAIVP
jgi:hypothetical protein